MRIGRFRFSILNVFENLPAPLQVTLACLRQRDSPRCPIEQPRIQFRFQIGHRARHIGRGRIKVNACRRETSRLGDAHENAHAVKLVHTIHFSFRPIGSCRWRYP